MRAVGSRFHMMRTGVDQVASTIHGVGYCTALPELMDPAQPCQNLLYGLGSGIPRVGSEWRSRTHDIGAESMGLNPVFMLNLTFMEQGLQGPVLTQ